MKYRIKTLLVPGLYGPKNDYLIQERILWIFWRTIDIYWDLQDAERALTAYQNFKA